MIELPEDTLNYINVLDPVESAARRQRVLEGETCGLMAETAAKLLASALNKDNLAASNQAASNRVNFYEALEANKEPTPTKEVQETAPVQLEPSQSSQPKKGGMPPGKRTTTAKQNVLQGAGSKKRNVQQIQNSPRVRKSYSSQSISKRHKGGNQTTQRRKPNIPKPQVPTCPAIGDTTGTPKQGKRGLERGQSSAAPVKPADFHEPPHSLP